jgi:Leucine-rich repeat (LRR) protein
MISLQYVDMANNKLSGTIPLGIGNLGNLTKISLSNNLFSGIIPPSIGNLTYLRSLGLGNNQLTGHIPNSVQDLKSLINLELNNNFLTGSIPSGLGNISSLLTLSLSDNLLSGVLPSSLANLQQLTFLSLSNNGIVGNVPPQIGNLTKLEFLYLQNNKLNGTLPTSFGQLTQLRHLFVSNNVLTGNIPSQVGGLSLLLALRLETNNFTGVPSSLSALTQAKRVLLPNPMTLVPYDLLSSNPSFTLLDTDWDSFLSSSPALRKRHTTSSSATMTANQLYALCPLNDVQNPEVPAGCIAGVYNKYCRDINSEEKLSQCQSIYDQVFDASIFKPVGAVCSAWKKGPRSLDCATAIKNFRVQLPYMVVTSEHAAQLVSNILASQRYAPCYSIGKITCRW